MTQFCDITQVEIEKLLVQKMYIYFLINDTYYLVFLIKILLLGFYYYYFFLKKNYY